MGCCVSDIPMDIKLVVFVNAVPVFLRGLTCPAQTLHKIHIHHAMHGHGGERWVVEAAVDGFHPETKPVYQYHGCLRHLRSTGYRVIEVWARTTDINRVKKTLETQTNCENEKSC